jgi:uncharacterized phage protein gp47/JayE
LGKYREKSMSLGFPSSPGVILEGMRSDSQSIVPELNSGLRESFHQSLLVAFANASFEQFVTLQLLIGEIFIDTATAEFLERWGSYKSITRNPASQAVGFITVSGIDTTVVPQSTSFSSDEGLQYETLLEGVISEMSLSVTSLTRLGNVATAVTSSEHNLASGINVTISGADQTEYNGTFLVTVTDTDEFTYKVPGAPVTPATGSILSSFTTSSIEVESIDTGANTNQLSGVGLTVDTPIAGLDDTAFVQFGEIGGGTDIESDEDLRVRILEAYQRPIALFNVAQIISQAKLVAGVTRVFVFEVTPDLGQVTVYFTRDNDENVIPSLSEVDAVKDSLLLIKPAYIQDADVIVLAPTPVTTDFIFSSIVPNTSTMATAIASNLDEFFKEKTFVGTNVTAIDYLSAINDTVDTQTGDQLQSFVLTSPVGDIAVTTGELAVLGVVNF